MKRGAARGVTLLELAIAIAVMTILGALALPALGQRMDQHRLYGAAEALAADLQEARFEAARLGRPLHIQMAAGDAWCWSVATESACPCGQSQPCELRSAQPKDHAGIRLVMARSMLLGANGVPESPGGATFESRQGARLRVDMQALGRARVCTAAGSAQRYPPC